MSKRNKKPTRKNRGKRENFGTKHFGSKSGYKVPQKVYISQENPVEIVDEELYIQKDSDLFDD